MKIFDQISLDFEFSIQSVKNICDLWGEDGTLRVLFQSGFIQTLAVIFTNLTILKD